MADNITLNSGTGGETVATDDDGTAHHQYVKVEFGADNTQTKVTSSAGLPVTPDSGGFTVTANLSATDNQVLDDISAHLVNLENCIIQDDSPFTPATGYLMMIGGEFDDAAPDSVDEGDAGNVRITANRSFHTVIRDNAGNERGLNVDANGAIAVTSSAALDVSAATVTVDLGANNDVTVTGGNAHDGTTLGNPVLNGARATNSIEGLTQVANADLTYLQADLNGVLLSRPHTTLEEIISERVSNTNGTSTAFSNFGAGGSGVHNYITTIAIYNSSATDGFVDFRDGTAGSIIFTAPAPQTGGSVINFPVPLKGADNTALAYDVSGALTTVYISVIGFQAQG